MTKLEGSMQLRLLDRISVRFWVLVAELIFKLTFHPIRWSAVFVPATFSIV